MRGVVVAVVATACLCVAPGSLEAQSLRGSTSSLDLQNQVARQHDFTWIRTSEQARWFVDHGYLVKVRGNADYRVKRLSHPYARPEVALFVSRLGQQYRAACGEQLVVTSLTRPTTRQPRNASARSVHPTGMALDLRRSNNRSCRGWLESVLLRLETESVLEVTYERSPPHYHIALFPTQYSDYVERIRTAGVTAASQRGYRVQRGDSLWLIAKRHNTSITEIRSANNLNSTKIYVGQVLNVPSAR